jgi:hypothetical protein
MTYSRYYKTMMLFPLSIIFLVCLLFVRPAQAATAPDHPFPRKANYYLEWTLSASQARELAKWDVVILDMEIQRRYPHLLKHMRLWNPDIVLLVYITPQEIHKDAATSFSRFRRELHADIPNEWYLVDSRGQRLSWWPGTYLLNVTSQAPHVGGERWQEYLVDFVVDDLLGSGLWDGVFYDNMWDNITFFVGNDVDTRLGRRVDPQADARWRDGMSYIYSQTRDRTGGEYLVVANGTTRAYEGDVHGVMIENFLPHAWQPSMNTYQFRQNTSERPTVNLINANTNNGQFSQHDYRRMRFGLGSTLLENGYYSFDFGDEHHGQLWWYDEYAVNLGDPLAQAIPQNGAQAYETDVWSRPFENGVAVVNSTGARQSVALDGEFEKIRGTQDVLFNDGSVVSDVTLESQDAQILLKTFETLPGVLYTNGAFVRFFRPNGDRVRNGFFSFDNGFDGGDQIVKADLDGNGRVDTLMARGNYIRAWKDDGQPLINKFYPYSAQFQGTFRIGIGDLTGNGRADIVIAPEAGYALPIKIITSSGAVKAHDWFPLGRQYVGGYSVAVAQFARESQGRIVLGTGVGLEPFVSIYRPDLTREGYFRVYERIFRGGVNVAAGDLDGDGNDEIVTGPGKTGKTWIKVFDRQGREDPESNFQAYETPGIPGIDVRVIDIDFDGQEDIIGMSEGI